MDFDEKAKRQVADDLRRVTSSVRDGWEEVRDISHFIRQAVRSARCLTGRHRWGAPQQSVLGGSYQRCARCGAHLGEPEPCIDGISLHPYDGGVEEWMSAGGRIVTTVPTEGAE